MQVVMQKNTAEHGMNMISLIVTIDDYYTE